MLVKEEFAVEVLSILSLLCFLFVPRSFFDMLFRHLTKVTPILQPICHFTAVIVPL